MYAATNFTEENRSETVVKPKTSLYANQKTTKHEQRVFFCIFLVYFSNKNWSRLWNSVTEISWYRKEKNWMLDARIQPWRCKMKDLKHVQRATVTSSGYQLFRIAQGDNIEEETRWGPRQAINICLLHTVLNSIHNMWQDWNKFWLFWL